MNLWEIAGCIIILIYILLGFVCVFGICWLENPFKCGNWLYHDILKCHIPEKYYKCYCDPHMKLHWNSKCKICGKDIVQDRHGKWVLKGKE